MTKRELVEVIRKNLGFTDKRSLESLELMFRLLKEGLERGEDIKISGFGKFTVRQKMARKGRNPLTGEEIQIAARRVVASKPGDALRKALRKAKNDKSETH